MSQNPRHGVHPLRAVRPLGPGGADHRPDDHRLRDQRQLSRSSAMPEAAGIHRLLAWTLLGLWIFITFWNFVTGEWKQYLPTTRKMVAVFMLLHQGHLRSRTCRIPTRRPWRPSTIPLQRLAYLSASTWPSGRSSGASGIPYLFYNDWGSASGSTGMHPGPGRLRCMPGRGLRHALLLHRPRLHGLHGQAGF